jgi:hypothetical protein
VRNLKSEQTVGGPIPQKFLPNEGLSASSADYGQDTKVSARMIIFALCFIAPLDKCKQQLQFEAKNNRMWQKESM